MRVIAIIVLTPVVLALKLVIWALNIVNLLSGYLIDILNFIDEQISGVYTYLLDKVDNELNKLFFDE